MSTQWTVGPGGPVGLNYVAVEPVLRLLSVPRHKHGETFNALRVMEDAALETMREQQQKK